MSEDSNNEPQEPTVIAGIGTAIGYEGTFYRVVIGDEVYAVPAATEATPENAVADVTAWSSARNVDALAAKRAALRDVAKVRRAELIAGGFEYGGKQIQTRDQVDVSNIDSAALAASNAPGFSTLWITADNSTLPLDQAGMIAMQAAMVTRGNAIFAAFAEVAGLIEIAESITELDDLTVSARTFMP